MSDVGFGKFGSIEWHENYIKSFSEAGEIVWYVFQARKIIIEPGRDLAETQQKAINALRVH